MDGDKVTVNGERLATLENDMKHTQEDVHEIRGDLKDIKQSNKNVERAVLELAEIAKTNQRIFPRIEKVEAKVESLGFKVAAWGGGLSVLLLIITIFGRQLKIAVGL